MGHSIQIPDALWDAYAGSPMVMRQVLNDHRPDLMPASDSEPSSVMRSGWPHTLKYPHRCDSCGEWMEVGVEAWMYVDDERKMYVHKYHVDEEGA